MGTDDWVILGLVTAGWIASTVFLFMYHSEANFVTWGGITATITGVYHFLRIKDCKNPDAS